MKIYNKKGFWFGVFWTAISSYNLISSLIHPDSNSLKQSINLFFAFATSLYGVGLILRAFSKSATREDYIEAQDERNQMIALKTKAMMMNLILGAIVLFMAVSIVGYIKTSDTLWIPLLLQSSFLFTVYWIISIFVTSYYKKHE